MKIHMYKSKPKVFKLFLNVSPSGSHKTTFWRKFPQWGIFKAKNPHSPLSSLIILKTSDRRATRGEIWDSREIWSTFGHITFKVI